MLTTAPVVVMGVSGCGKTTVGSLLATRVGAAFIDADDLHSLENIAKMAVGDPLTDEDRRPWLGRVGLAINSERSEGHAVVVACSALRWAYREELRQSSGALFFVHLVGDRELLWQRIGSRTGHFMPSDLLDSQLATLEPLEPGECGVEVDVGLAPEQVVEHVLAVWNRRESTLQA